MLITLGLLARADWDTGDLPQVWSTHNREGGALGLVPNATHQRVWRRHCRLVPAIGIDTYKNRGNHQILRDLKNLWDVRHEGDIDPLLLGGEESGIVSLLRTFRSSLIEFRVERDVDFQDQLPSKKPFLMPAEWLNVKMPLEWLVRGIRAISFTAGKMKTSR